MIKKIKTNFLIFSLILTFGFISGVKAEETIPYYTNGNGVTLSEEQYNNLIEVFSENTLYSMSEEQINVIKDETEFEVLSETAYIKTTDMYNVLGEYTGSIS